MKKSNKTHVPKKAIAIDGPAGAGKSTVARLIAKKLGFVYIDTGAMYRAVALSVIRKGIDTLDSARVAEIVNEIDISIKLTDKGQEIYLGSENVNGLIRTPEISAGSSNVALIPEVRKRMIEIQRNIAQENNVVMDGRDIGTNVLPNADMKIYLTASVEARAKRRYDELKQKGYENISLDEIEEDIKKRDFNDINREHDPLKAAADARVIDTTDMTIEQAVSAILQKKEDIEGERLARRIIHKLSYVYSKTFHRIEYIGLENIPKEGALILYSNHISNADPFILTCTIRRMVYFMAKEELFKGKLASRFWEHVGAFPVKRGTGDIGAIKKSLEKLKKGAILCMFPEGTRRKKNKQPEPKPGLAMLAIRAKCPVLPSVITATPRFWNKIKVIYGKPFDLSEYYGKNLTIDDYTEISKKLMKEVDKLKEGNKN